MFNKIYEWMLKNDYKEIKITGDSTYFVFFSCVKSDGEIIQFRYDKDVKIGFPLIGAGLAKCDWHRIAKIIEQELGEHNVTIVEYSD